MKQSDQCSKLHRVHTKRILSPSFLDTITLHPSPYQEAGGTAVDLRDLAASCAALGDNQNCAVIFTRGEVLQMIDANQAGNNREFSATERPAWVDVTRQLDMKLFDILTHHKSS